MAYASQSFQIGPQGRIVIPAAMRARLGMEPGTSVLVTEEDGRLVIQPQRPPLQRFMGRFATGRLVQGADLVSDELMAERRAEVARDLARELEPAP